MFLKKISAVLVLASMLLSACSKKQDAEITKTEQDDQDIELVEEIPEMVVTVASSSSTLDAVMLGGSLWTYNSEGYMEWLRDIPAGTKVGAYKNTDTEESYPAEIKRDVLRSSDWGKRNYVHIVYNSNDYWVQEIFIAVDAKPAIVLESGTPIFPAADPESHAERWLGQGTLIAVYNTPPENTAYAQISVYVKDFGLVPNRFIQLDKISVNEDDIMAMQLYAKLHQVNGEGFWIIQDMAVRNELQDIINRLSTSEKVKAKVASK